MILAWLQVFEGKQFAALNVAAAFEVAVQFSLKANFYVYDFVVGAAFAGNKHIPTIMLFLMLLLQLHLVAAAFFFIALVKLMIQFLGCCCRVLKVNLPNHAVAVAVAYLPKVPNTAWLLLLQSTVKPDTGAKRENAGATVAAVAELQLQPIQIYGGNNSKIMLVVTLLLLLQLKLL